MPEPTVIDAPTTLDVTDEQRQALAECVAIVTSRPELTKRSKSFLIELWATVATDETLEG